MGGGGGVWGGVGGGSRVGGVGGGGGGRVGGVGGGGWGSCVQTNSLSQGLNSTPC